mgnify:FL=1
MYIIALLFKYKINIAVNFMNKNLIVSDPEVMMGKPVISGTRITVELILEKLSYGESIEQILESYPQLTRESIYAALNFAAKALKSDVIYPVSA